MNWLQEKLIIFSKFLLIGRDIKPIDKFLFSISKGQYSGWVLGNSLRSSSYGKAKHISKEPLIVIGGFPRSGTTLLRAMLEQHKEIASPGIEVFPFQELHDKWRLKDGFGLNDKEIASLEKYKKDNILYTEKISQLFKKKKKTKYVLFKHPKYMMFLKKFWEYFPNSKAIHIIRDGKNSTMSQKYWLLPKGRKEWPYDWCCRQWVTYLNRARKFKKDKRYIEIKYEDLIYSPEHTIKKITDFLELTQIPKKKLLEYYKKKESDKHKDHPDVRKPLKKENINKWLNKMSKKDKKIFNTICGKLYKELDNSNKKS